MPETPPFFSTAPPLVVWRQVYELYDGAPMMSKWLEVTARPGAEVRL